jgi:copper chaperone CopZ
MEKFEGKNVIITIIDTLDGPEEVSVDLDKISLEEIKKMIPDSPDLLPYYVERTLSEVKSNKPQ